MSVEARKVYRSSKLVGTAVMNNEKERLGEIEEVVLDLEHNTLAYAAVSFGGFLGLGAKLFAVPWSMLQLRHDADGKYFLFNVAKQALKEAPGFDPDNWPDVSSTDWREAVDGFYRGEA